MNENARLVIILPASIYQDLSGINSAGFNGAVQLSKKFITGMEAYCSRWPGVVECMAERAAEPDTKNMMDAVWCNSDELPFRVKLVSKIMSPETFSYLKGAAIVVGAQDKRMFGLHARLRVMGIPSISATEYNLKCRLEIIKHNPELSIVKKAYRMVREYYHDHQLSEDLHLARGLQCNGVPTYNEYEAVNKNCILYFDTRTSAEMCASSEQLISRDLRIFDKNCQVNLAFSGRLIEIKGAQFLVPFAAELRRLRVPFTLKIFGDGHLKESIQQEIDDLELNDQVKLMGVLPFKDLMVELSNNIDLFVAPHIQSDPSCTYLETLAAGVPIVGFDNEAWQGILDRALVGWSVPINDVLALAEKVQELYKDRWNWSNIARSAADFARQHTYEKTFDRRVAHLRQIASI